MNQSDTYQKVVQHAQKTGYLKSTQALLEWDQQTQMPLQAGGYRADQITHLAGLIHQAETDKEYGDWLGELAENSNKLSQSGAANIAELKRRFKKKANLPENLVTEMARVSSVGQQTWVVARKENDFAKFAPILEQTFQLKREQADAVGFPECRYDALLDDYEPHALTSDVCRTLESLRKELVPLIEAITSSTHQLSDETVHRKFPIAAQREFANTAAAEIGFEFDRGVLAETAHPFCTTLGPNDIRLATRYDDSYFNGAFFGTLHEAGHGIYEQGLPPEDFGLPSGEYCSLGVHESQSRMWENLVGRSLGFWEFYFEKAQSAFPEALANSSREEFFESINRVSPSLIRVEADEATYDLHIIIRFELERALIEEELSVQDLPEAWNNKYEQYLGIVPPNDAEGVMQDVHWSAGLVGYFPTYSLGNIYASQLFAAARDELGGLERYFRKGEFFQLKDWLNTNVHQFGCQLPPTELVRKVTGRDVNHQDLIEHLKNKFGKIYQLGAATG